MILPVLRPLLDESGSGTARAFECADVCGFNVEPNDVIQQQIRARV